MNQKFMDEVAAALGELTTNGKLTGWTLKATESRSLQRLYSSPDGTGLSCHQSRHVNGDAYKLSVFVPSITEGMIGTAMVDLVSLQFGILVGKTIKVLRVVLPECEGGFFAPVDADRPETFLSGLALKRGRGLVDTQTDFTVQGFGAKTHQILASRYSRHS